MRHDIDRTAFVEKTMFTTSATRRGMVLGAMFGAATQGALPLTRVLAALRDETGADAVTLLRVMRPGPIRRIATTAPPPAADDDAPAMFADGLRGSRGKLMGGVIIQDPDCRDRCGIVLIAQTSHIDLLVVAGGDPVALADFAAMAAPVWAMRRPGLVVDAIHGANAAPCKGPRPGDDTVVTGCVLSAANPAGLTPTEIRVALALRDGLSPADVARTLAIAMPTVRTHLRNLYAKTGLRGMHELTHRLHADAAA